MVFELVNLADNKTRVAMKNQLYKGVTQGTMPQRTKAGYILKKLL